MVGDGIQVVALKCPQCGADVPQSDGYVVCQHCGSSLVVNMQGTGQGGASGPTVFRGMKLAPFTMQDPGGTGLPVFRMLAPVGWEMCGGMTWDLANVGMPGKLSYQLWNPRGLDAFEIHPNMNFTGGGLGSILGGLFGCSRFGAEVRNPVDAQTAMRDLVIPRYRSDRENLQVVHIEPFPELAQHIGGEQTGGMGMRQVPWSTEFYAATLLPKLVAGVLVRV